MKKFRFKIFSDIYPLSSKILTQIRILGIFWITTKRYDYITERDKAKELLDILNK